MKVELKIFERVFEAGLEAAASKVESAFANTNVAVVGKGIAETIRALPTPAPEGFEKELRTLIAVAVNAKLEEAARKMNPFLRSMISRGEAAKLIEELKMELPE